MAKNILIPLSDYAVLCGVSKSAIYMRIRRDVIRAQKVSYGKDEAYVIDISEYPPAKFRAGRKRFKFK